MITKWQSGLRASLALMLAVDGAFPSNVTYTGASLATMTDSTGKIAYKPNNLFLRTEDQTHATYTLGNVTVLANQTTAPDGALTADSITGAVGSLSKRITQSKTTAVGNVYIGSAYVKQGTLTGNRVIIRVADNTGANSGRMLIDIVTGGVISSSSEGTATLAGYNCTDVGNGWFRISVAVRFAAAFTSINSAVWIGTYGATSDEGFFYTWGWQLEATTWRTTPGAYVATTAANYFGPRFIYDRATLRSLGYFSEEPRTNLALWSDDLTNAAYTKSNLTTAKTAEGPDGVTNSATTCTATAANATALQSITSASAARVTTFYLKRRTGTGTVNVTQDNGTTWTAVDLSGGDWVRGVTPVATAANPIVGIRVVTSGDAVDVYGCQHELTLTASPHPTSLIPTTSATVARAADSASLLISSFPYNTSGGTLVVRETLQEYNQLAYIVNLWQTANNTASMLKQLNGGGSPAKKRGALSFVGAATQAEIISSGDYTGTNTLAYSFAANNFGFTVNGTTIGTDVSGTLISAPTVMYIGTYDGTILNINGCIEFIKYYPVVMTDGQRQVATA